MRKTLWNRFRRDEKGAVAVVFGLSILPLTGLVGTSLDYNRASAVRIELQGAVDAASLALAKDAVTMTPAQASARGVDVFLANWSGRHGSPTPSVTVTRQTDRFQVAAAAQVPTTMMQLFGVYSIPVSVQAVAGWGINKIEIALVLDNTGSMGWSNKMPELKKALCGNLDCSNTNPTSGFVAEMRTASVQPDQIRIALVPFDTTVRVPLAVQNAVTAGTQLNNTFSYAGAGYCASNPTTAERVAWTLPGAPPTSWFRFASRDKDTTATNRNSSNVVVGTGCGVGRATRTSWQGCLWDRDQNMNRDTGPTGVIVSDIETLYPAVNCRTNNLARMAPLVDVRANTAQLINQLATMQPSGNTNLTIGVSWGANMLMPGAPMSTAAAPDPNLSRFMILLTDGDNTENRQGSSSIDARTRIACANAKSQGVTIYAVRVIEGNQALLRECASGPGFYFEVSNAAQLDPVFKTIAGRIGSIRLTN
jgi:Flp pilus assembly protein TadG